MTPMSDDWTPTDTTWNNDQPQNTDWSPDGEQEDDGDTIGALPDFSGDSVASTEANNDVEAALIRENVTPEAVRDVSAKVQDATRHDMFSRRDVTTIIQLYDALTTAGDECTKVFARLMGKRTLDPITAAIDIVNGNNNGEDTSDALKTMITLIVDTAALYRSLEGREPSLRQGFDIMASIDRIDNDHMKLVANAVKDMNINVEDAAAMRVTAKMDTMDIASNFTESIRDFVNNGGDYAIVDWLDTMGKIL